MNFLPPQIIGVNGPVVIGYPGDTMRSTQLIQVHRGTPVHSMRTGKWKPAGRDYDVQAEVRAYPGGWVVATWPGGGGYWRRICAKDGQIVARFP